MKRNKFIENLFGLREKEKNKVKANLFGKIQSPEEALATIYLCGKFFLLGSLFSIAVPLFFDDYLKIFIPGSIGVFFFGILLIIFKSRTISVILLLLEFLNFYLFIYVGGTNLVISLILIWLGIRALYSTIKYHKFNKQRNNSVENL
jgi:hypothetical protein